MGYLDLRFRDWELKLMLCLGDQMPSELQEPDFMFLATGPGSILGDPTFLERSI